VYYNESSPSSEETKSAYGTSGGGDYFYNYPEAGMDIQFNGITHAVTKIHITANLPGHAQFLEYDRCCFIFDGVKTNGVVGAKTEKNKVQKEAESSPPVKPPPQPVVVVPPPQVEPLVEGGEDEEEEEEEEAAPVQVVSSKKNKKKKNKQAAAAAAAAVEVERVKTPSPPMPPPVPPISSKPSPTTTSTTPVTKETNNKNSESLHRSGTPSLDSGSPLSIHDTYATFLTGWSEIESSLFKDNVKKPQPVVHNNGPKNPFQPTQIYCAEPHCRALFKVGRSGFLCGVTLY
jgi:hypothetical protein